MPDLIVAGAGPAGLATALFADRAGLSVLVCEPRATPVDKACGEGLMPGAVVALADLGVHPTGRPFLGIDYLDGRTAARADFRAGPGLGVRRTELAGALRAAVDAAGIPVRRCAVEGVELTGGGVRAAGTAARWLVAADGLHSPLRRSLGLDATPSRRAPARFGLRRHVALAPWTDHVEVHWARHGEAYVTPVGPQLVGVAVLTRVRGPFEQQLAGFPALAERLAGARPVGPVRGAGPLRQRSRRRVAGPVLLVGDAAGYVDALTGEGIAVALASARAAVAALAAGEPERYEAAWRQVSRRYRWLTHGLLWVTRPAPARARIVPAAHRLPRVFDAVVDQLAG